MDVVIDCEGLKNFGSFLVATVTWFYNYTFSFKGYHIRSTYCNPDIHGPVFLK